MIVVDASALVEVLLGRPGAKAVEARIFTAGQTCHAPHLIDVEIAQVIRRFSFSGDVDDARGRFALTDLADFPIVRYPHEVLLLRIWELRNNMSAYDAAYVALAEGLGAPLLTRDRRLAASVGHHAQIDVV